MNIYYGINSTKKDITQMVYDKCSKEGIVFIPASDVHRAQIFGDPLPNVLKSIFINDVEYLNIDIYIENNIIYTNIVPDNVLQVYNIDLFKFKLDKLHQKLKLNFGSFKDEYPEQLMAIKYLKGNEKVLEIGGNIGRNSLIIGTIVEQLLTLETDQNIVKQLTYNRDINNMKFLIENSALSNRRLIQRGWDTIPSDKILPGFFEVKTISWNNLYVKYNIVFDTLVLDCEGAFYYILIDMPEILTNINLIIMENDYHNIEHKTYVDSVLLKNNFYNEYKEAGGWGPCKSNFFEVWKKDENIIKKDI